MLNKLTWQDGAVLSIELRRDLFTLAQMRDPTFMQFFDIRSADGVWAGVDLDEVTPLFCIKVAEKRLKSLFVERVAVDKVRSRRRPIPLRMIDYDPSGDGDDRCDLIELSPDNQYSNIGAKVVKPNLTIPKGLDVIYGHEIVGMFGDPEKLRRRLVRYFDTGVNWDDSKESLFKGIKPPLPKKKR